MGRKTRLLTDEVAALAAEGVAKLGKSGAVAIKLRIICAAHQHGITAVCKVFDVTKATVISWVKTLREESIEGLDVGPGRGRKSKLNQEHRIQIRKWLEENPQQTIDQIKNRLMREAGVNLARSSVHREMKDLPFSYTTPRPRHYKKADTSDIEAKKKSGGPD